MVGFNLANVFEAVAGTVEGRDAVAVSGGHRLSHAELDARADRFAAVLAETGLAPGATVGLALRNRAEHLEAMLGAFKARAVPVNCNPRYTAGELAFVLADSAAQLVVHEADLAGVVAEAVATAGTRSVLLACGEDYEAALAGAAPAPCHRSHRSGEDRYVCYTGGTTARPRGVVWRHHDLFLGALSGGNPGGPPPRDLDDVIATARSGRLCTLPASPLTHGTAAWSALATLANGGTVVLSGEPTFRPEAIWDLAEAEAASMLVVVGDAFARPLADALGAAPDRWPLEHLLVVLSGGAALSPVVGRELADQLPQAALVDSYGTSESGGHARATIWAGQPAGPRRFEPSADTVVLGDDGRPLPSGVAGVGPIARRGHIPLGYLGAPEVTRGVFRAIDGVAYSVPGDLARVDADGNLTLIGRGETSINTGGEKVHPEEVEAALKAHPAVFDAVVVGIDDAHWGQQVGAAIALRRGRHTTPEDLRGHCRASLAGFKIPRRIALVDTVGRLASGKADERWARQVLARVERTDRLSGLRARRRSGGSMQPFNIADVVDAVAEAHPDRTAIVWRDRRITYADLVTRTDQLGRVLAAAGLGCHTERADLAGHESGQDHVGLYLHNGNEYLEGMIGAWKARAAPFNVNYRYVASELEYLFNDARARAVIYHGAFAPRLAEVRDRLGDLEVLLQVDDGSGEPLLDGAVDYEQALAAATGPLPDGRSPDDLYILYTGGTTGMPKGVLWRSHDIYVGAMGGRPFGQAERFADIGGIVAAAADGGGVTLVTPPLMHGAAQWSSFNAFTGGNTVAFPDDTTRLDPADVWRVIDRERVLIAQIVGDAFGRPLIEELERGDHDGSSLLVLVSGGAALHPGLKERFCEQLPGAMVLDAVGASETGAQMGHTSTKGKVATGEFTPGPGTIVLDDELSAVLEPGHDGTGWLAQRGEVPLGYLGDEAKTTATFPVVDGERMAVPGDRARHRADGVIELLGRDSATINSGGEKIFAEEVEAAIAAHPGVADVVVCGRPSERWGAEVVAVVQVAEGAEVDDESLLAEAANHVARFKLPKSFVYVGAVARSPAGKADYRWARETVAAAG